MSYVVETGGKQYLVKKGDIINVEKLNYDEGEEIKLKKISDLSKGITNPTSDGDFVLAKVLTHLRWKKDIVFKKKRRQNYRRKMGHRQSITKLEIISA